MKPKSQRTNQEKKKQRREANRSSAVEERTRRAEQMSGVLLDGKPRHPEGKSIKEALAEDEARFKAQKGLIDKRSTLIKVSNEDGVEADAGVGASMRPNDEELAKINGFTRKPVTADEVVAFPTLSCNDMDDRDDDRFSTQCVKDFAALEQPFSPTGKSFMLDHNYSVNNAVGRIFDTTTDKEKGVQWLKNKVYVPNTAKNAGFIEDLDFGINWAVSVGVTLGKSTCTVCGERFSSWGWWCTTGHDKGYYYDPNSDETDSYGYPVPVDPKTNKNAVKCVREFSDPIDMYELSQVFLGAQYFAALDKTPEFAAVMKSASKDIPILGLSAKEAEVIPFRHEPEKVSEARKLFKISEAEDGSLVWTDAEGIRWTFNPENSDEGVLSLGRAAQDPDNEEGDEDGEHSVSEGSSSDGEGDPNGEPESGNDGVEGEGVVSDPSVEDGGSDGGSTASAGQAVAKDSDSDEESDDDDEEESDDEDEDSEDSDEDDDDDEDESEDTENSEEEKAVNKKQVIATAKKSKLPASAIKAAEDADGDGLAALLSAVSKHLAEQETKVSELTPKASLGDTYLKELRASAIDAYVKNNQSGKNKGVDTSMFERLLDKCGDDAELIKALAERELAEAQAKFPKSVRRSSFPSDPHSPEKLHAGTEDSEKTEDETGKRVRKLHS